MVRPHPLPGAFCSIAPLFAIISIALAGVSPVAAQELTADVQAPAHIALVDGVAVLERDGAIDESPASMPLLAGDRVRTRAGRVEILFADGSTLHLDHHSTIDLQSDELVRLIEGRIRLSIPGPSRAVAYRIDGPHGWAHIDEPGEYRVALLNAPGGSELELAVIRGRAELANDGGRTPLRAGERAFVRAAAAPSYAFVLNSAAWDAFDRWSEARREERMSASAQYLPDEVRPYAGALDRHGYWREEPRYGRVWYPRVQGDWRPYYHGRWAHLRPYGWTWVAHDPWGWPTHHYGRWGFASRGWFWIPGRTWGAAWVSWASAPGYVSWCPLGWNNRPVLQISINVGRGYDPWRAWTVLPQRHFGRGYVHRNVVRIDRVDTWTRGAFRLAERAPMPQGQAVPRASTPIRVAGTNAGRRSSAPLYTNLPADRARIRTDGARIHVPSATGARPSGSGTPIGPARERTTPSRPAVRSERPEAAAGYGRSAELENGRRRTEPQRAGARPRLEAPRAEPRRGVPRAERAEPDSPRYQPSPGRGRSAVRRDAPAMTAPARPETPVSRRPSAGVRPAPRQGPRTAGERAAPPPPDRRVLPPEQPARRAVPRGDAGRPPVPARQAPGLRRHGPSSGEPRRAPQVERRGPDRSRSGSRGPERPSSGSYERRQPPAAQPSTPSKSGERPAGPASGARPRPSGGAPAGTAVRKPGGGGR